MLGFFNVSAVFVTRNNRSEAIYLKIQIKFQVTEEMFRHSFYLGYSVTFYSQQVYILLITKSWMYATYLFIPWFFSGNYRKNYIPLDVVHWKRCRAVGDRSLRIHPSQGKDLWKSVFRKNILMVTRIQEKKPKSF